MTEPAPHPPKSRNGPQSTRGSASATPRWVKGFGIVVVLLLIIFIAFHLTGNGMGGHG